MGSHESCTVQQYRWKVAHSCHQNTLACEKHSHVLSRISYVFSLGLVSCTQFCFSKWIAVPDYELNQNIFCFL